MWFLSALVQNVKQATKFKAERIFLQVDRSALVTKNCKAMHG
jgi:hypothetical protein